MIHLKVNRADGRLEADVTLPNEAELNIMLLKIKDQHDIYVRSAIGNDIIQKPNKYYYYTEVKPAGPLDPYNLKIFENDIQASKDYQDAIREVLKNQRLKIVITHLDKAKVVEEDMSDLLGDDMSDLI